MGNADRQMAAQGRAHGTVFSYLGDAQLSHHFFTGSGVNAGFQQALWF